jgi:hypothetical protein
MYIVANGYSFVTARGVLKFGDEIQEGDFASKDTFLKKVEKKHIIAGKTKEQLEKEAEEAKTALEKEKKEAEEARLKQAKEDAARNIQTAEAALKGAKETLETAKKEAAKKQKLGDDNPEYIKAIEEVERAEAALTDAEANLDEAQEVAKAVV